MPRSRPWAEEDGSASLEFIVVGLVLLVPLVYLVVAIAALQSAAFGVEGAARQASRVYVQSASSGAGEEAARTAIAETLADYGLDAASAHVQLSCRPDPARCLTRRSFVTVRISTIVPLPLLPPVITAALPAGIPVESVATEQVSRFWGPG